MRMTRFSRINTIWKKELIDTLRDRRTVVAMVLVPMVLYPAMMLGSIGAFELQVSYLVTEEYTVAVPDPDTRQWLRHVIDSDPARRIDDNGTAEEIVERAATQPAEGTESSEQPEPERDGASVAKRGVRERPPPYRIVVVGEHVVEAVTGGAANVGLVLRGPPPRVGSENSSQIGVAFDESDIRSEIAASGLEGVLARYAERILLQRLAEREIDPSFVAPLQIESRNVASAERMTGSVLGRIVPLILIVMTITGAIYPAIDLTAGERERGTLETLMVAPVATSELVFGKFIVITLIGLLSALLNLVSIGGTIWLGGVGSMLAQGQQMVFPLGALPWVFLLLVPLAVLFSAVLLAVCSFARSFKEAQNYIAPVMMAALIPGVVGILPGTQLKGPILIMPVANIVVLTRELFLGKFDFGAIAIVAMSTSLYAGAAIAIATKLFGQEAVLFADSGSIRTLFQRKFFKPRPAPSCAVALLVLALVYTLNFYVQNSLGSAGIVPGVGYLGAIALTLAILMGLGPYLTTLYLRASPLETFRLRAPTWAGWAAAVCFGLSTWVLIRAWFTYQETWLPFDPRIKAQLEAQLGWISSLHPATLVFFLALVPAFCEELFFRGFVLSGVRTALNRTWSVIIVALAFGLSHYMIQRLPATALLGAIMALLVVQYRSIYPAILAHFLHNALTTLSTHPEGLLPVLRGIGFDAAAEGYPPTGWLIAAAALSLVGLSLCLLAPKAADRGSDSRQAGAEGSDDLVPVQ